MSMSSYEGWEPDDWEYWEGTIMPFAKAVGTDTIDPSEKPVEDVTPIDDYDGVTHPPEVKKHTYEPPPSEIERRLEQLREQRMALKEEMRNLRSYPTEDDFPDGTVVIWQEPRDNWGPGLHGVAVKDRNRWYVAGEIRSFRWDEIVARSLSDLDFSEVEVVRPAADDVDEQ